MHQLHLCLNCWFMLPNAVLVNQDVNCTFCFSQLADDATVVLIESNYQSVTIDWRPKRRAVLNEMALTVVWFWLRTILLSLHWLHGVLSNGKFNSVEYEAFLSLKLYKHNPQITRFSATSHTITQTRKQFGTMFV